MGSVNLQSHPEGSEAAELEHNADFLTVGDIVETTELCKLISWCKVDVTTSSTQSTSPGRY